jgi:tetratricopeptide (TPR) repeat protein
LSRLLIRQEMAMTLRSLTFAIGPALLLAPPAPADESWVGLKVMNTRPKVRLTGRAGDKAVEFDLTGSLLPVLEDRDGRLRVRDYLGKEGWAEKANFVRVPDAPAFFTDVIRRDPKDAWAWSMRGAAWALNGNPDHAIRDHSEALRLDPTRVPALVGRAGAWGDKGEWDKAIRDLDAAMRLDPAAAAPLGPARFFNFRGCLWLGKGDAGRAIRDFDEAIRHDPEHAPAFNHRGNAWEERREYDRAIRDYTEAIRLGLKDRFFANDGTALVNRGNLWHVKKEYAKALRDFDDAVRLDPKNATALHKKAYLLATCADDTVRDVAQARELMKVVVTLRPTSPHTEELLGVIAAAGGSFEDAIRHQKEALADKHYADRHGAAARVRLAAYEQRKAYRE